MTAITAQDRAVLRRAPLFAAVKDDVLDDLLREARIGTYPRGQILFLRGDPAERFYLLLDGWVKIFLDTPGGEQTVIEIMRAGETIAEAAIFLGMAYPASAEVADDARLIEIPAGPFLARLRRDGELALTMLAALSKRLHYLIQHIEKVQTFSTPQRLGGFLLDLTETAAGKAVLRLPYDEALVAARLGMKPESLSRALAKLRDIGVVTQGDTVHIADVERLREFCEGDE